jgi:hypothetical protein
VNLLLSVRRRDSFGVTIVLARALAEREVSTMLIGVLCSIRERAPDGSSSAILTCRGTPQVGGAYWAVVCFPGGELRCLVVVCCARLSLARRLGVARALHRKSVPRPAAILGYAVILTLPPTTFCRPHASCASCQNAFTSPHAVHEVVEPDR